MNILMSYWNITIILGRAAKPKSRRTLIDDLHRMILDDILIEFGMSELDESQKRQLNQAWHRLQAWPDSAQGIMRLKTRYITTTLSNGNINLLINMAKAASLNWDCVLSAEVFKAYKPDPALTRCR